MLKLREVVTKYCIKPKGSIKSSWFGLVKKELKPTHKQIEQQIDEFLSKVNRPVIDVCDDILLGNYITDIRDCIIGNYNIVVGGIDFNIKNIYHMSRSTEIIPNITLTTEEHSLFIACLQEMQNFELTVLPREEVMSYYEER